MGNPRHVRPDELEILVARELRKAGVELAAPKVLARRALSPEDPSEYVVELTTVTSDSGTARETLIECRNESRAVSTDAIRAFEAKLLARTPSEGSAPLGIMFSTSGYEADAVRVASAAGIALLAISDGRAAFLRSQWAMGSQPPAWVPEYMAELVDLDASAAVRYQLLVTGKSKLNPGR